MQVALIGFGLENQAAFRYWQSKNITPVICDQNTDIQLPEGAESQLGESYLDNLDRFDIVVRTVGMHPQVILDKNPGVEPKITTAVNLFFEECKTPIIGVTGTKGKGTTSTLIYKILEAAGKKVLLAGNIGTPMLDILPQAAEQDFVVLELSSFQLYDLKYSPHIAVCLMVVPEHLNWHTDMSDYKQAKANLFRYQSQNDVAIFNALNPASTEIAAVSPATTKLTYAVTEPDIEFAPNYTVFVKDDAIYHHDQWIARTDEVKLLGRHNLENVCAAVAATIGIVEGNTEAIKTAVANFTGLEHRLEFVRELNGVKYYDDSFSTTPETAIAALKSFVQPKIVILGGADKGIPFGELASEVVKNNVKHVLTIGQTGPIIANLLQKLSYTNITTEGLDSMPAIVDKAKELADEGDVVLLSTGTASFGMFHDYKDRGNQFKEAVKALA